MSDQPAIGMRCAACGSPAGALPLRCPRADGGDGADHLLGRVLIDPSRLRLVSDDDPNPFLRYRQLLYAYQVWRAAGRDDAGFVELVRRIDDAVAEVDGRGFGITPFAPCQPLGEALGVELWIKDETGNVSGSHKGRHLMGTMVFFEVARRLGRLPAEGPLELAVASCGNAALAAAVVSRAAGHRLRVFIPPDADPPVVERLGRLGAQLVRCPRREGEQGDPCYLRFREAIAGDAALPFSVQGNENGITIEGGMTLALELIEQLGGRSLARLVVQVGGGALASACSQALGEARQLGALEELPRLHAVQTRSAYPLRRAYDRLVEGIAQRDPSLRTPEDLASPRATAARRAQLREAQQRRGRYMWSWESEPRSIAHGILDDETYDWHAICAGMLESGGFPLVVDETVLARANALGREKSGIDADETGTAGLAGALELAGAGGLSPGERVAVLFTGQRRRA